MDMGFLIVEKKSKMRMRINVRMRCDFQLAIPALPLVSLVFLPVPRKHGGAAFRTSAPEGTACWNHLTDY